MKAINYRAKQISALSVAIILYMFFLIGLLFDFQFPFHKQYKTPAQPLLPHPAVPTTRSKGPAPVRYYTPPQKPQQQTQAIAQQASTQQTQPQPKAPTQQKDPLGVKKSDKKLPKTEKRKTNEKPAIEKKIEPIPRYKKRSRDKWFKDGSAPAEQAPQTGISKQKQRSLATQMNQGFSNYITKQKNEIARYSIPKTNGNRAESLEYEMFVAKLVRAICEASYHRPLTPHTSLVKGHVIGFRITCNQDRTISDFAFTHPSYDCQINEYIEELVRSATLPRLPEIHSEPKLTLPLRISVERQYYARNITLVPA